MSLLMLLAISVVGQANPTKEANADQDRVAAERLAYMKTSAKTYEFLVGEEKQRQCELVAEPLLRWNNPIAEEHDAALFLWTDGGRPVAAAQFFARDTLWMHEFQSLWPGRFSAQRGTDKWWQPARPGLAFQRLGDVPEPAATAGQRLAQMRTLAGQFTASVEFQYEGSSRYELRLLSRPIYRYGGKEAEALDGAIFAFVQGTNPEVLLLVESRETKDGARWHFACAAMTSYPAEATRDGKQVWSVPKQEVPTKDPTGNYYFLSFREPAIDQKVTGQQVEKPKP
jgi:hypothetical protein